MRLLTLLCASILLVAGIDRADASLPPPPLASSIEKIDRANTSGDDAAIALGRPLSIPSDEDDELIEIDSIRHTRFNLTGHAGMMFVDGGAYEPGFCYGGDIVLEQSDHIFLNVDIRYAKLNPKGLTASYTDPTLDIFSFAIGGTYRSAEVPKPALYVGAGMGATSYQVPQLGSAVAPQPITPPEGRHVEKVRISSITLNGRIGFEYPVLGSQRVFVEAGYVKNLQDVGMEYAIPVTAGIVLNF